MPKWQKLLIILGIITPVFFAVILSLVQHWEPNTDMWGYWVFARVARETGKFIIIQRSPPYTLYLNLFRFLGFPTSITIEYIVTALFTIFATATLFRSYLGTLLSFFAVILWLPYMQAGEPAVQKIALGLSCLAVYFQRFKGSSRLKLTTSYALFLLAYLFRPIYNTFYNFSFL